MIEVTNIKAFEFESVPIDSFWNTGNEKEAKMHRIHSYPAKFPAFITTKALEFAAQNRIKVNSIADIFCGCGTTAFEARRNNISYWGCDINPVATLIAKVKSKNYQNKRLESYKSKILACYENNSVSEGESYQVASERLKYWYQREQFEDLYRLRASIFEATPKGSDYQLFFLCAFSNILKATSRWLTKSIKPQIDPVKDPAPVLLSFEDQVDFMIKANSELDKFHHSNSKIVTNNILEIRDYPKTTDLIITSPPYVTSYEYADLHQLSSLWLEYAEDYRLLRNGSIGSLQQSYNFNKEWKNLNETGNKIVSLLIDQHKSKARAVAKYFLDMQSVSSKAYSMLSKRGLALFVIGNTEYKGVRIDNAKHLTESLLNSGFRRVCASKRKISNKILTPYRTAQGKFSTDSSGNKIYSEEFIIVAYK